MINWFNHCYPYTNFHELNLDWVIYTVKKGEKDIKDFIGLNTIKYADPILWDITRQYEANTVVVDPTTGNAFISVKAVPYGTHINNTDYWTQIYNYADVVDTLREQIASNEGLSTTATKPYSVDDLVFTNNELYRVIAPMIAGDSFVVDSNIVKTTIDEELKLVRTALDTLQDNIDAEALAREQADDTLQNNIDAEAQAREDAIDAEGLAREQADDTLQDNIDAEAQAREDADNAIIDIINNLDIDSVYNESTPDSGLTTNIGLKQGTYNINTNTTINAQLIVPKGAIINVASDVTLTINGQILAGRYTIFTGDGTVVVNREMQEFGYPEWFNNNIQKTVNTFSKTILAPKTYYCDGNVWITDSNTQLIGSGYGTYFGNGRQPSRLRFTSGRLCIGNLQDNTIIDFPRNITVKDLELSVASGSDAMSVFGVVRGLFENLYLTCPATSNGIAIYKAISSYFTRCYVQCIAPNANTFYGIRFLDSFDHTVGGRSASVWVKDCTVSDDRPSGHATSYGLMISGIQSDIYADGIEVNKTTVGCTINVSNDASANIRIINSVFDSILSHGLEFNSINNNCMVTFNNNYIALVPSTTDGLVYLKGSGPIEMLGLQLLGTNASQIGIQSEVTAPKFIATGLARNITNLIGGNISDNTNVSYRILNAGTLNTLH